MLTKRAILEAVRDGKIEIDPFDERRLNPNSYNLTLGKELKYYTEGHILDPADVVEPEAWDMQGDRWILWPGNLYLGYTAERTAGDHFIPMVNGRSSLARLGISVHQTGGFGDIGFSGHWTLEFTVVCPAYLYPGMEVLQICWFKPEGDVDELYRGKYSDQPAEPISSRIQREFD
jgi:dCTP deaminase